MILINNYLEMSTELNKPFLIGICGGSASGKTSVANIIFKYVGLQNCLLFSMDMYYKGPNDEERKHLSDYNFDHPDALDLDLLRKHLKMLSEGKESTCRYTNSTEVIERRRRK